MKASCSVLPDLDIAGEGETGADRAAGDLALEEEGGAGDRPRRDIYLSFSCLFQDN